MLLESARFFGWFFLVYRQEAKVYKDSTPTFMSACESTFDLTVQHFQRGLLAICKPGKTSSRSNMSKGAQKSQWLKVQIKMYGFLFVK